MRRQHHDEPELDGKTRLLIRSVVNLIEETTENERAILKVLYDEEGLSTKEIAPRVDRLYPQVCNYLNSMSRRGILKPVDKKASRKTKHYKITREYLPSVHAWIASR